MCRQQPCSDGADEVKSMLEMELMTLWPDAVSVGVVFDLFAGVFINRCLRSVQLQFKLSINNTAVYSEPKSPYNLTTGKYQSLNLA